MIAQALKYDGPALVEVLVSRQELSMPPTITYEQAKGFSLFMMKAVLSGRGDEIIDLGKGQSAPLTTFDHEKEGDTQMVTAPPITPTDQSDDSSRHGSSQSIKV